MEDAFVNSEGEGHFALQICNSMLTLISQFEFLSLLLFFLIKL